MDDDYDIFEENMWDAFAVRAPHAFRPETPQQNLREIVLLTEEVTRLRNSLAKPDDHTVVFLCTALSFLAGTAAGFLLRYLTRRNP
jgi:hypothetical protein